MQKWLAVLVIILFCFPASAKDGERPEWISKPTLGCFKKEICVIGSGSSLNKAKIDGQNEILKVFENNIKSSYSSKSSSVGDDLTEEAKESVESFTEGVVSGSKIKHTFSDASGYYVQVSLDKEEAKEILLEEIKTVDKKMKVLLEDDTVSSNSKLKNLYSHREALNRRYTFLNEGKGIPEEADYAEVFAKIKRSVSMGKTVFLNIKEPSGKRITNALKKILSDNGVKVSRDVANYEIRGELNIEKEHFNVDGFVKNFYALNLETVDTKGRVIGNIYITLSETGRNENQALSRALAQIIEEMKNNFEDLAI